MSKRKSPLKFSANACCQPLYAAIHEAIKDLSKEQAKDVLEELHGSVESQLEAIEQEIADEATI